MSAIIVLSLSVTNLSCASAVDSLDDRSADSNSSTKHDTNTKIRVRSAVVDEQEQDGAALTARLRWNWQSQWAEAFRSELEIDGVLTYLNKQHNNGLRDNNRPQIPDVGGSEINQALLIADILHWRIRLGRQAITYDNQRFIGRNGFWQNDQTFDAIQLRHTFLEATRVEYSYIANANRIFGSGARRELDPNNQNYEPNLGMRSQTLLGDHEHRSHLVHASVREWQALDFSMYYYDIHNLDVVTDSNRSVGLRVNLNDTLGSFDLKSTVETALQTQPWSGTNTQTRYQLAEFSFGLRSAEIKFRHENRGAHKNLEFITPLASLHNFNGWADKFSARTGSGVKDNSVALSWRRSPIKIDMRLHQFASAARDLEWGRELDMDVILKVGSRQRLELRYANFQSSAVSRLRFPSEQRIYLSYRLRH